MLSIKLKMKVFTNILEFFAFVYLFIEFYWITKFRMFVKLEMRIITRVPTFQHRMVY